MDLSCTSVRERLSGFLDRALPLSEREAVGRHLAGCPACEAVLADLRDLVGTLHALDRVSLPDGFEARFQRRLAVEAATGAPARPAAHPTRRFAWRDWLSPSGWPVRALAGAAVGVLVVFAFLRTGPESGPTPGPMAAPGGRAVPVAATPGGPHIGLGGDAVVRIWFDSAEDVGNVRFTLELPAGVRMVKDGQVVDSPFLTWEGELKAGRNLVPLHVRGVARGDWTVTAKVEKDGARRARSIGLTVNGA